MGLGAVATVQVTKSISPLVAQSLRRALFRPKLVSRHSVARSWKKMLTNRYSSPSPTVIADPEISDRLERIVEGLKWTHYHRGYFSHLLLFGQPGTGKTLYAEKIAMEADMDFVMISGPSFDQFSAAEAIQEIKNLFGWANSRRSLS